MGSHILDQGSCLFFPHKKNLSVHLITQDDVFDRRRRCFIFPTTPGGDVQWSQKCFHDSCTTPCIGVKSFLFAAWWRPSYVWYTSLTECKLGSWILPCWEHGAIINVDHSIEDASQGRGERESVKRAGIVRPGWGVGKRNVGWTWAVQGLRERDTIVPHSYPLSQIRVKEAWGHSSCCSVWTHITGRAMLRPASSSQQILYAHSSKPFCHWRLPLSHCLKVASIRSEPGLKRHSILDESEVYRKPYSIVLT